MLEILALVSFCPKTKVGRTMKLLMWVTHWTEQNATVESLVKNPSIRIKYTNANARVCYPPLHTDTPIHPHVPPNAASTWAPTQYPKRRLSVRSRKYSKPRDLYLELPDRSEIWQALRQHCCRCACQISKRYDNLKYQSRGFETSRDLTKRRLFGYWDGVLKANLERRQSEIHTDQTQQASNEPIYSCQIILLKMNDDCKQSIPW